MKKIISAIGNHPLIAERPLVKQVMKFGMVGAINTFLDFGLYTAFVTVFHIHYLVANALSFCIALVNSFYLNRTWTFRQTGPHWRREAVKYLVVYVAGLIIGETLLFFFVDRLDLHKLIGKALVVAFVLFWNYFGIRFWAFRRHQPTTSATPIPPATTPSVTSGGGDR